MRFAMLGLVPLLLAFAVRNAQDDAGAAGPAAAQANVANPAGMPGQQSAAEPNPQEQSSAGPASERKAEPKKVTREQARQEAKARKEAEKEKRAAAKDAKYLKLQNGQITARTFDEQGNPVKVPPCAPKDKPCEAKRKELLSYRDVGLDVRNGMVSIDGWIGITHLNYDVKHFRFVYVSVPGYGTVIASPAPFTGAKELNDALESETLTVTTSDAHTVQLTSEAVLASKAKLPVFYRVDRSYLRSGNTPSFGYGVTSAAPYAWPVSALAPLSSKREVANASRLPARVVADGVAAAPADRGSEVPAKASSAAADDHSL